MSPTSHVRVLRSRLRTVLAGALIAGALLAPLGVATPEAGALGSSPFCHAVFNWTKHPARIPTKVSITTYHTWVKETLPYYERMEATAPNAKTKAVLTFVVTVLKTYGRDTNLGALGAYERLHARQFAADVKALVRSIIGCLTGGIIKLP